MMRWFVQSLCFYLFRYMRCIQVCNRVLLCEECYLSPLRECSALFAVATQIVGLKVLSWGGAVKVPELYSCIIKPYTRRACSCCFAQPACQDRVACQEIADAILDAFRVKMLPVEECLGHRQPFCDPIVVLV